MKAPDFGSFAKALGFKGLRSPRPSGAPRTGRGGTEKRTVAPTTGRDVQHAGSAPREPRPENPREERLRKALEEDRKLAARYKESRLARFRKISEEIPAFGRYCAKLAQIATLPEFEVMSRSDCNFDIAELVRRYNLIKAVSDNHDRFFLFEITCEWLDRQARAKKIEHEEDPDTWFATPEPTTLSEVKAALNLS